MTYSESQQSDAPLGVGSIIGDSFSILFRHFPTVLMLAVIPTLAGLLVSGMLTGFDQILGLAQPSLEGGGTAISYVLAILVQVVAYGLTVALLVQMAYDAKLERQLRLSSYFGPALGAVIPIAVLGFVSGILVGIGAVFLILPGLWVYAVFSVVPVAVVIERVGFGGLGRSAELTKGYRWPIVGTLILIGILIVVLNLVATYLVGVLVQGIGGGVLLGLIGFAVITAVSNGTGAIVISLIYARLREIKEGASISDIAAAFE
jgi:hypothetical protein